LISRLVACAKTAHSIAIYPMHFQKICLLLCLPLLACGADKDDSDSAPGTTTNNTMSAGTGTSTGDTAPVTTSDADTSATATATTDASGTTSPGTLTSTDPTTGGDPTGDDTTGDDTTGDDTTGDDTTGDDTTTTGEPAGLSWALDVHPVVVANNCGCHGNGAGGLTMTGAANSHTNLVGVMSNQSKFKRVEPGDPGSSYLVNKLDGTHINVGGMGQSMPLGAPLFPKATIELVEQWIADGALP